VKGSGVRLFPAEESAEDGKVPDFSFTNLSRDTNTRARSEQKNNACIKEETKKEAQPSR